jgi:hypothetical protein
MPEAPNPESRADSAILCLCIGVGLMVLAWFMGISGIIAAVATGNPLIAAAGSMTGLVVAIFGASVGSILAFVGFIWLVIRVIADSREANSKERYSRDVQR